LACGDPIPEDAIPPAIATEYVFAYVAFCELSGDRQLGMGRGPIPFTAIDAYAGRCGMADADEFSEFAEDIRLLDRLFLEITDKKPDT
jgi:hypothetical protein